MKTGKFKIKAIVLGIVSALAPVAYAQTAYTFGDTSGAAVGTHYVINAVDDVVIHLDTNDGTAGTFYVTDWDGTGRVNVITSTHELTTIGSDALTVTGTTQINNTLSSTGDTTLGTTSTTNTIGNAGTSTNTLTGATNNLTATTANNITGATNINTTGVAATNIGAAGSTNTVLGTTSVTGATTINNTAAANATTIGHAENTATQQMISGASSIATSNGTNTINGATNINVSNNAATNIGTGTTTSAVTIGNAANTTTISSGSVIVGTASYGINSYATTQTVVTGAPGANEYLLINGDANSRALVDGSSVQNIIKGNTLVDGNMYINGTLTYSSNSAATTTVTSGTSVIIGATQQTTGQMAIVNTGGTGAVVDANGNITTGAVGQTTGALLVTNGMGNTHGFVVTETQATMSGGTRSTSLTLDDNGARFSNSASGAPVTVTGVADGRNDFDAVNYRQLKGIAAGVASTAAMANIPMVDQDKTFAFGIGVGNFMSQTALAAGASYRFSPNGVVKASLASGLNGRAKTTVGAGLGWSF